MRLLVISPHMDDETLGAGGTMLKYAQAGEAVYWLNISNAATEYGYSPELTARREEQRLCAAERLGVREAIDWKLKPAALSAYLESDMIGRLGDVIRKIAPEMMIVTSPGDIHSDHAVVYSWVKAYSKAFRLPSLKRFLLMEVISETDFELPPPYQFFPNFYVDITGQMERKAEILSIYREELGEHPFPRSLEHIRALALHRGVVAGTQYAEAFMLLREIEK